MDYSKSVSHELLIIHLHLRHTFVLTETAIWRGWLVKRGGHLQGFFDNTDLPEVLKILEGAQKTLKTFVGDFSVNLGKFAKKIAVSTFESKVEFVYSDGEYRELETLDIQGSESGPGLIAIHIAFPKEAKQTFYTISEELIGLLTKRPIWALSYFDKRYWISNTFALDNFSSRKKVEERVLPLVVRMSHHIWCYIGRNEDQFEL